MTPIQIGPWGCEFIHDPNFFSEFMENRLVILKWVYMSKLAPKFENHVISKNIFKKLVFYFPKV